MVHLEVDSKIPSYIEGKKKICKKKIQEIMKEYGYDEEVIESIDDHFCLGFGIAKEIIVDLLKEKT